jgi:hypothetical protein
MELVTHIIKQFDELPDDAVVPRRITAAVLGVSERTVRRYYPTVRLSPRLSGNRVGDIRAIVRGRIVAAQAPT